MGYEDLRALSDDFRFMQEKDLDVLAMISGQKGMGKSNAALGIGFKYFREYGLKCNVCHKTYISTKNFNEDYDLKEIKNKIIETKDELEKKKLIEEFYIVKEKKKYQPCPYCRIKEMKKNGKIKKNISIGDALLLLTRMEEIPFNPKLHKVRRVTKDDYKHFVKESIAYDNEDIREKIYNLPPYSVVHADEGLRFLMASDWNKSENKELKKIVGQCRTKHLIFLICIPSFSWVDKKYRNDMCNYWIRLVMRGTAIISVPNLGEVVDPWDMKLFSKYLGSYTHISTIEEIEKRIKKLLKHPNVRDRINIPKVSKALYKYYLEFRDMRALSKKNNEEKYVDKKDELAILLYTLMHYDPGPNVKRTFSYKDLKHYLKHPVKGDIMFTSRQIINKCRGIRKEIKNFNELAKQKLSLKKKMEKMEKELYQPKNKEKNNIDPLTGMKLN